MREQTRTTRWAKDAAVIVDRQPFALMGELTVRDRGNRLGVRRPGAALILVVAVLGILFVAGAALLNQVTFSTSTLEAARETRQIESSVDAIEDVPIGWLANGFIGPNGQALLADSTLVAHKAGNPNTPCDGTGDCVLTLPAYSEVPGIHSIDLNEPVNEDVTGFSADLRYKLFSNPVFAEKNKPGVDPFFVDATNGNPYIPGANVAVAQAMLRSWDVNNSGDNVFELARDADGDGIVDSFQFPMPDSMLPTEVRRDWADRLRDPDYNLFDPDRDPDQLWISLKIVPHGAMLNINSNGAADTMVNFFFSGFSGSGDWTGNSYPPQTNEWYLRHRGLMLPRTLPRTALLEDYGRYLVTPHEWPQGGGTAAMTLLANPDMREWWGYDFAVDANNAASTWTQMVLDPNAATYDFVHNVTTISHDDQLMRPVRNSKGVDMIEAMRSVDGAGPWNGGADAFELDNYPQKLDLPNTPKPDPRLGRMKVSFKELTDMLGVTLLKNLSMSGPTRDRIVGTIQQAFLLMLSNHRDFNRDGTVDGIDDNQRAVVAAMLTANLIDFADFDDSGVAGDLNGESIGVDVVGTNGLPITPPLTVFGFERQPYITEVYAQVVPATPGFIDEVQSSFAIELYNPYSTVIHLDEYHLEDVGGSNQLDYLTGTSVTLDEDLMSLSTKTIQPGGFYVIYAGTFAAPTGIASGSDSEQTGNAWSLDQDSIIQLTRTVNTPGGPVDIVVDEFNVNLDMAAVSSSATPSPISATTAAAISWERDNSEWTPGESRWRFVVPRVGETLDGTPTHTLGALNTFTDPLTFSVHVDVANVVNFEDAFPTTGSMLLIPRMAHVYDPAGTLTSPFNRVNLNILPSNIQTEFDRIENGRIPVFDLAVNSAATVPMPLHRDAITGYGVGGLVQGVEALPWGQLIFDYFTGLPLEPCDSLSFPNCNLYKWPKVDQEGLRVHGRININAASALVLSTAPMLRLGLLPPAFRADISDAVYGGRGANVNMEGELGLKAAKAIVWYREAMDAGNLVATWDFESARDPYRSSSGNGPYFPRQGYGFLTVGELFNVISRTPGVSGDPYGIDAGTVSRNDPNNQQGVYDRAVGRMVAMGDWLTTRSHVFTVYGVVRGQFNDDPIAANLEASLRATDQRAIRFQTTVDRLPMFFGRTEPERIGAREVSGYADVRAE